MRKQCVCILCPMGCRLHAEVVGGRVYDMQGNHCPRGEAYGTEELLAPKRMITAVIPMPGSRMPLPVKTSAPIPKDKIPDVLAALRQLYAECPVEAGDIVVENIAGTGADIIATRSAGRNE